MTLSGSASELAIHGISFANAKQTGQPDAFNEAAPASTANHSLSVTTVADRSMVVGIINTVTSIVLSPGAGQTKIASSFGDFTYSSYEGPKTPAGAVTHSYVVDSLSETSVMAAISIAPTAPDPNVTVSPDVQSLTLSQPTPVVTAEAVSAITFDAASQLNGVSGTGPHTWDHAIAAGNNRLLTVLVCGRNNNRTISDLTANGVPLTQAKRVTDGSTMWAEVWYLVAPPTGTVTISATVSGLGSTSFYAASFRGIEQSSPVDTSGGATGTAQNPSNSVTTTQDAVIVDALVHEDGNALTDVNQETIGSTDEGTWATAASYLIKPVAGSQAMAWSAVGSDTYAQAIAAFKAAGGAVNVDAGVQTITASQSAPTVTADRSVTVSPSVQGLTANQVSPTVSAVVNVTVSPAVQELTASLQAPTVSTTRNVSTSPAVQDISANMISPTITADREAVVSPTAQSISASQQSPVVTGQRNVSIAASVEQIIASLQAPTISTTWNALTSPVAQTITSNTLAPTVSTVRNLTTSPAVQSLALSQLDPTVSTIRNVTVSPAVQSLTLSEQSPTVSAGRDAVISPAAQEVTASTGTPTITTNRSVSITPLAQDVTASQASPTVSTIRSVTVSPEAQTLTANQLAAAVTLDTSVTVSPSVQTLTASMQAPTVTAATHVTVSPTVQTVTGSLQAPAVSTSATVTPAVQTLTASSQGPTVAATRNALINPSELVLTASVLSPGVGLGALISPAVQSLSLTQLAASVLVTKGQYVRGGHLYNGSGRTSQRSTTHGTRPGNLYNRNSGGLYNRS